MPRGRKKKSSTTTPAASKSENDTETVTKPLHEQFKADDLVWIRMGKYPWWPARVNIHFFINTSFYS